jgi:hypothetical protein
MFRRLEPDEINPVMRGLIMGVFMFFTLMVIASLNARVNARLQGSPQVCQVVYAHGWVYHCPFDEARR